MSESILAKYSQNVPALDQQWVRCLNLVRKNGTRVAFSYSHFIWANFDPSLGLQMHFATHTITMKGRNLGRLYEEASRLELYEVKEVDERRDMGGKDDLVVTELHIMQKPDGTPACFEIPGESL